MQRWLWSTSNEKINQLLLIGFLAFTASHIVVAATNNVKIKGRLVNSPCVVLPENKNVEVDFGDIRLLDIYDPTYQLPRREMTLTLSNCGSQYCKENESKNFWG
ncbi:fimbrial protein [Providencia hangzhouensis]|uniref:fimbrial protein n=1 Tax=Providencia hangzhouensis TaxID=3031799 RepID=UPI0034DD887C